MQLDRIERAARFAKWAGGRSIVGNIFHVNGSTGDDNNPACDPLAPMQKIDSALALCADSNHDYILVEDYYNQDTFPVVVDKTTVHIIGLGGIGVVSNWCLMTSGGAACFQIGASALGAEIAGFSFISDATHPCILIEGTACTVHIHHNAFALWGAAQDGILAEAGDELSGCLIEHNMFEKGLVRDGLRVYSPSRSTIADNLFRQYGGVGINLYGDSDSARVGSILRNKFFKSVSDPAAGWAITIVAAQNGMIDENHAMEAADAPTHNPYKDNTTGTEGTTKNAWGVNYTGAVTTYPDVA